jgi:hypothetical protein
VVEVKVEVKVEVEELEALNSRDIEPKSKLLLIYNLVCSYVSIIIEL